MIEPRRSDRPASPYVKTILFLLIMITGVAIFFPMADFQLLLSQGDHGRDLYAFNAVRQGETPYKDFWWVYGPLMPYYYSLVMSLLGVSIKAVLAAKLFLVIISGLFVFLILSLFISPVLSFIGTLWFYIYQPDFFYTYNHAGGILAILAVFYSICLYIKEQRISHLYAGLLYAFLLCLIKLNFGLAALLMIFISRITIDLIFQKKQPLSKRFYVLNCIIVPLCVLLVYMSLLIGLSESEIRQCLPYLSGDEPRHMPAINAILQFISIKYQQCTSALSFQAMAVLFLLCLIYVLFLLRKLDQKTRRQILLFSGLLIVFYLLSFNEYIVSGVVYRSFWATPFEILFLFFIIGVAIQRMNRFIQYLLHIALVVFLVFNILQAHTNIGNMKKPDQFLSTSRAQIYLNNSPQWITTVNQTVNYIFDHLGFQEKFFAMPYYPLYYYLTDRASPTRQLIFFEHIHIGPEQEKSIIDELNTNGINWIIMSNRSTSSGEGLGQFGRDYCPLLYKYIESNFESVAQFGDWSNEPEWAWNHGTKILKRRPQLPVKDSL